MIAVIVVLHPTPAGAASLCPSATKPRVDETALRARSQPPRARLGDYFTPKDLARADAYNGLSNALGYGALAVDVLVVGLLGLVYGKRLGGWGMRAARDRWKRATLLLTAVVVVVPPIATLPFAIASHAHDKAFGLATDATPSFLVDWLKALGFAMILGFVLVFITVGIARRAPRTWPVIVAAVAAVVTFLLVYLVPLVYDPAFNRFTPALPATAEQVLAVARAEG
ncbi:MAG: hypothetical protein LC663_01960, partial [Actinobacteria bacterium]|nr:hypothetical protein [Actinomycetota bacterium]